VDWANKAGFNVVLLPLTDQARVSFDEEAARKRFWELEGVPYGYSTIFYGWLDTPNSNFPMFINEDF